MLVMMPLLMAVSPASVGAAVPLYALLWLTLNRRSIRWHLAAFVAAVALYGWLSATWALAPDLAAAKAGKFALVSLPPALLIGVLAMRPALPDLARFALWGIGVAAGLLAVQTFCDVTLRTVVTGPLAVPAAIKTNVPAAALAILAWQLPMAAERLGRNGKKFAGVIALVLAAAVFAGDGVAPRAALIAGAAMWLVAHRAPKFAAVLLVGGLVVVQLAAPRLGASPWAAAITDPSMRHRVDVWALTDELIAARPWLGYGFGNSSVIPPQTGTLPMSGAARAIPMYPHNVLLQARLELGIGGLLAFYTAVGFLVWRAQARPMVARASALALIAATLAVWCVGYPLWRSTWLAWLWFVAVGWCVLDDAKAEATCRAS